MGFTAAGVAAGLAAPGLVAAAAVAGFAGAGFAAAAGAAGLAGAVAGLACGFAGAAGAAGFCGGGVVVVCAKAAPGKARRQATLMALAAAKMRVGVIGRGSRAAGNMLAND